MTTYDFLKDFASPIATFIGASAAVSVTYKFAHHQREIAKEQTRLTKEKLRLDLFDRRLEAFSAIFLMYNALIGWEGTPEQLEIRARFFKAYQESGFLFKPESGIRAELELLNDAAIKMVGYKSKEVKDAIRGDKDLILKSLRETNEILLRTFPDALERIRFAMSEYLNFHDVSERQP
jgi:hypothetical protein